MKIKTSELTGIALDWAVGLVKGYELNLYGVDPSIRARVPGQGVVAPWKPTTNWAQGGLIIEREKITVVCAEGDYNPSKAGTPDCFDTHWVADIGRLSSDQSYGSQGDYWGEHFSIDTGCVTGPTPLIAAMRCYVASKLGDEVEIPDELG